MNQLYSEQEKFLILEVEVPAKSVQNDLELAKVDVRYTNLYNEQEQQLNRAVLANFSRSELEVQTAVDVKTYEAAVEQVANEESQKAIELRDQGDIEGAKSVLKQNAIYLDTLGQQLSSPKLLEQKAEALQDATELERDEDWNKTRKQLKERQYKRATQQTY